MTQQHSNPPFQVLESTVMPLFRDHVDTDQIIPASYLKVTDKVGLGKGLFANWRYLDDGGLDPDFVLNQPAYADAKVLVGGHNFGCGSSREHAPWAMVDYGFRAVIAVSFADIFLRNALENALLPVTLGEGQVRRLAAAATSDSGQRVRVDLRNQRVTLPWGDRETFEVDPFARHCLLEGVDSLGFLLSRGSAIDAYEQRRGDDFDSRRAMRSSTITAAPPRNV